jgi:integrase/recombinase XerD
MTDHLPTVVPSRQLKRAGLDIVPVLIADAGEATVRRFIEFFTANIRNKHTREAYARAVAGFCAWCEGRGITLAQMDPVCVAAYIEQLTQERSKPTVKQHLAAVRMLFDWLVTGGILPFNPATSVRGPKYVVKRGKTLVLEGTQAQQLLDSIDTRKVAGLRDRALIGLMIYSFARVSAMLGMRVEDYYQGAGRQMRIRLHEKGGKEHDLPVHHRAVEYLEAYLAAAEIAGEKKTPLFRSVDRSGQVTERVMARQDVWGMIRRRVQEAGLPERCCAHTFRATGITVYLSNGGTLENAQFIANHSSPRTTKLYDRTEEAVTLDEINRIDLTKPPVKKIYT